MGDDERKQRLHQNEEIFRKLNTRGKIGLKSYFRQDHKTLDEPVNFMCECSNMKCEASILMSIEEYEQIHSKPDHYCLLDGHDIPEVEKIVNRSTKYIVVQKI